MLIDMIAISGLAGIALPKLTWPLFVAGWMYYLWEKRSAVEGTQAFLISFRYPIYTIASGLALFLVLTVYEHYRFVTYAVVSEEPQIKMTAEQASNICKSEDPNSVLLVVRNQDTNISYGRCDEPFKYVTYQIIENQGK